MSASPFKDSTSTESVSPTRKNAPEPATLAIVKPGFLELLPLIVESIENQGFQILTCAVPVLLERAQAEQLYAEHSHREHFPDLVDYMISGACMPLLIGRARDAAPADTIRAFRQLVGAEAQEGRPKSETIRGRWGRSVRHNVIHASDSVESFERERAILFPLSGGVAEQ